MKLMLYLFRYVLLLSLFGGLLTACSSLRTYPDNYDKNLLIKTTTDSGSVFSSVKAALDIYSVDGSCKTDYLGTVKLDSPHVRTGIPHGKLRLLSFHFGTSGFLSSSSSISYDTLFRPRMGYRYHAEVKYVDNIYNVEIFEITPGTKKRRELPHHPLHTCKQN